MAIFVSQQQATAFEIKALAGSQQAERHGDLSWIEINARDFYRDPHENLRRLYQSFCRYYG